LSGAAFLRLKKLKGSGIIGVAARHNRRAIQAEIGASGSIDPARSHLNETLIGPSTADGVATLAKELMREAGINKLRKDAVMGLELVFSLPPDHRLYERAYFADCANWAGDYFGGTRNVLSADIHRDEAQHHCHVLLLPLIQNKMTGSDIVGNKQRLLETQKQFHAAVASRYGLMKAPARLIGTSKQAAVKEVLKRLRDASDPALRSAAWPTIREGIERDPGPMMMALGIELPEPKKQARTMAQIFTSRGKRTSQDKETSSKPYRVSTPEKEQTLCSVGFTPKPTTPPPPELPKEAATADQADPGELVRVRDCDLDPALWDESIGGYRDAPPKPSRRARAGAESWVKAALLARGAY
jgi:hypothetical protein